MQCSPFASAPCAAFLTVSAFVSAAVHAEPAIRFNLPPQALSESLRAVGSRTGTNVIFEPGIVEGLKAPGLSAELTADEAIRMLLAGTRLGFQRTSPDTIVVTREGIAANGADAGAVRLAQSAQPAGSTGDPATDDGLQEVVVRGIEFRDKEPSTATKLVMDVKDIPQSLVTITSDVMDFASIRRFDDIYRVDASSGSTFRQDGFPTAYFRGFTNQGANAIRIDGFRFIGNIDLDLVGFDRFEVVKGPSSALFGQNTIGGTLNAVTKKPQGTAAGSLRVEGGSDDFRRGELDFTGPIDAEGRWKYRLVGAYEDSGSYLDYAGRKSTVIVPSLSFDPTDRTHLMLTAYYNKQDGVSDWGTGLQAVDPAAGEYRLLPLPRSHFFGEPWNHTDQKAAIITFQMQHEINDDWQVRFSAQHNESRKNRLNCSVQGNPDVDGRIYPGCFTYLSEEDSPLHSGEVDLIGNIHAFGRTHTLLLGVDYARQELDRLQAFDYVDDAGHGLAWGSSIGYDVLNPVGIPRVGREDFPGYRERHNPVRYSGITAQLLLHPLERLSVLLAGRYNKDKSSFDQRSADTLDGLADTPFQPTGFEFDLGRTVGQAGITYALTAATNVYVNWGQTYEPGFGRGFDPADPTGPGIPLPPEEGEQFEVGFKTSVLENRLSLTFAAFDMDRSGIIQSDREHPDYDVPLGTQRSRGLEFGAAGELAPGWQVYASASVMDAKFVEGEFVGEHAANAPKRALSVFTSYQVQGGPAQGLGVGLGYVHKDGLYTYGQVFGHDPIRFDFGDIDELDLRVFYNTPRWEAFVSARNLLADKYYAPSFFNEFRWGISVNPGRVVSAGVTYKLF